MNGDVIGWFVTHEEFGLFREAGQFECVFDEECGAFFDANPENCEFLRDVAEGDGCVMLIHSDYSDEWVAWARERGLTPVVVSRQDRTDGSDDRDVWFLYGEQNETLRRILDAETCERIEELLNDLKREDKDLESLLGRHLLAVGNRFLEKQDKTLIVLPEGMDTTELTPEEVRQLGERYGR